MTVEETLIHGRVHTDQHDGGSKECPPPLEAGQHLPALCLVLHGSRQGRTQQGAVGVTPTSQAVAAAAGAQGRSDVARWPHAALSQHTQPSHPARPGPGNRPGRGTTTAPLRAPGKGHAAPAATLRQAEGRQKAAAGWVLLGKRIFAQDRSPAQALRPLDFLWDRAWAGYEPFACTLQPRFCIYWNNAQDHTLYKKCDEVITKIQPGVFAGLFSFNSLCH